MKCKVVVVVVVHLVVVVVRHVWQRVVRRFRPVVPPPRMLRWRWSTLRLRDLWPDFRINLNDRPQSPVAVSRRQSSNKWSNPNRVCLNRDNPTTQTSPETARQFSSHVDRVHHLTEVWRVLSKNFCDFFDFLKNLIEFCWHFLSTLQIKKFCEVFESDNKVNIKLYLKWWSK